MAREMKDSGVEWIGDIPKNWEVRPVKSAFNRKKEKAQQKDPVVLSLARSGIRVRNIKNNEGQLAASYENYNPVEPGDLLLNPMDLYSGANCNLSEIEGVISPAYVNLRAKDNVDSKFYDYYFKTQYWSMAFFAHGLGVSFDNRWTLNNETLMNYKIPVPSYQEQKIISETLNSKVKAIDSIVYKTKQSIEEYKKYKQSLIREVVTKGLDQSDKMKDSGVEWIGEIPEHWNMSKLGYLGSLQNGISIGGEFFGEGNPFVSYSDVYRNYQLPKKVDGLVRSNDKEQENYSVHVGDVFFTRTSETIEEVGFASTCFETIEKSVFAGFLIRFRQYEKSLSSLYSKYFFRSDMHRKFFVKEMNLVTRASLSQGLLKKLPVILPPYKEQEQIGRYLEDKCIHIDMAIEKKHEAITELESYKKSLIYEVVTGKKEIY